MGLEHAVHVDADGHVHHVKALVAHGKFGVGVVGAEQKSANSRRAAAQNPQAFVIHGCHPAIHAGHATRYCKKAKGLA